MWIQFFSKLYLHDKIEPNTLIHNSNTRYQHYSTADWALGKITDRPQINSMIITLTITTPAIFAVLVVGQIMQSPHVVH